MVPSSKPTSITSNSSAPTISPTNIAISHSMSKTSQRSSTCPTETPRASKPSSSMDYPAPKKIVLPWAKNSMKTSMAVSSKSFLSELFARCSRRHFLRACMMWPLIEPGTPRASNSLWEIWETQSPLPTTHPQETDLTFRATMTQQGPTASKSQDTTNRISTPVYQKTAKFLTKAKIYSPGRWTSTSLSDW